MSSHEMITHVLWRGVLKFKVKINDYPSNTELVLVPLFTSVATEYDLIKIQNT